MKTNQLTQEQFDGLRTLTFKIQKTSIVWHWDNPSLREPLCGAPFGTKDDNGYISTGIHFSSSLSASLMWWVEQVVEWLYEIKKGKLSESEVLEAVAFIKAIWNNANCIEIKKKTYERYDGSNEASDFVKVLMTLPLTRQHQILTEDDLRDDKPMDGPKCQ